jgi:hypothetical protein
MSMMFEITARAVDSDGDPIWSYSHVETVTPTPESYEETVTDMGEELIRHLDRASTSIAKQVGQSLENFRAYRESQEGGGGDE